MGSRREFAGLAGAALAGAALRARGQGRMGWQGLISSQGKRMLVLGGTGYVGPALVRQAVRAGYAVTLFNRGITRPGLFPEVEHIRGVRSPEATKEDLSGLKGRRWDVVVDVWPQDPAMVASAAKLLAGQTEHYMYVSSISSYDGYPRAGMDESAPLRVWTPSTRDYEHDKAGSEHRLQALVGGKLTVVRPGPIMGDGGGSPDVYTWLARAQRGGRHLAPGAGDDSVEFVDVKDVAGFLVLAAQRRLSGAYNLTGRPLTFRAFLDRCKSATASAAEFVWVPQTFLEQQGLKTDWELQVYAGNFPLWRPEPQLRNIFRISSEKAYGAGWQTRPFDETAQDILLTFAGRGGPALTWKDFLPPEREQQVLDAWEKERGM